VTENHLYRVQSQESVALYRHSPTRLEGVTRGFFTFTIIAFKPKMAAGVALQPTRRTAVTTPEVLGGLNITNNRHYVCFGALH
jgi:hypothetical protein